MKVRNWNDRFCDCCISMALENESEFKKKGTSAAVYFRDTYRGYITNRHPEEYQPPVVDPVLELLGEKSSYAVSLHDILLERASTYPHLYASTKIAAVVLKEEKESVLQTWPTVYKKFKDEDWSDYLMILVCQQAIHLTAQKGAMLPLKAKLSYKANRLVIPFS